MQLETLLHQRHETASRVYELAVAEREFAPNYYQHPDALALLLKTTAQLEQELRRFNRQQVEGIESRFNLAAVHAIKLDQFDDLGIFVEFVWEQDENDLSGIFARLFPQALEAGAAMSMSELGFDIDYSPADQPAIRFLERHVPRLAKDVTDTTRSRVKNSIREALLTGKDRDGMITDLKSIIDSEPRRRMIAQTESVTAFSEGRIQAGIEMGATHKCWRAQVERCPICAGLHGETVPLTATFSGGYYSAPAHPHCRCGVELSFGRGTDTATISQYRSDYLKSLRSRY